MNTRPSENDQATLWNGRAGQAWIDAQHALDQMFAPFEPLLVDAIDRGALRVLDVGCGTGATTLAAARHIGPSGHCVGVDISAPMLDVARDRAARENLAASFVCADAASHDFGATRFNAIISRFGVMFFDDFIAAFANLRRAANSGAMLRFAAWRGPADNPFMTTAERAAAPFLPELPPRQPNAPGQFAFADEQRVRGILQESGWREIDIQPIDVACAIAETDLDLYFTRLGPLGGILPELDKATRARITDTVRAAFAPYVRDGDVRFTAACWLVGATAP